MSESAVEGVQIWLRHVELLYVVPAPVIASSPQRNTLTEGLSVSMGLSGVFRKSSASHLGTAQADR